jgi:Domain of unknown function (DUF6438)
MMLNAVVLLVALQAAPEPIRITLERTACYGACPVYSVVILGDGTVTYTGRTNVRVAGVKTKTIPAETVRDLAHYIESAGFFEMKDEYSALVTDLPTTYVTVTLGRRTKKIKDYFGAPAALKEIEARIDQIAAARGYISIDAATLRQMREKGWRAMGQAPTRWMDVALSDGDAETVRALLAAGMDVRTRTDEGVTLVMKAAMSGDPDTVRTVLAAGGDPTARDVAGRNAADRVRDAIAARGRTTADVVRATGRPRDYAAILRLLTDE